MPSKEVFLTRGAERDLESIFDYIASHDSPARADAVLARMAAVLGKLAVFPERGSFPKELIALGIRSYRQVFFKPCRIIYQATTSGVFVVVVADGRRDMEALLTRRLLQP